MSVARRRFRYRNWEIGAWVWRVRRRGRTWIAIETDENGDFLHVADAVVRLGASLETWYAQWEDVRRVVQDVIGDPSRRWNLHGHAVTLWRPDEARVLLLLLWGATMFRAQQDYLDEWSIATLERILYELGDGPWSPPNSISEFEPRPPWDYPTAL